MIVAASLLFSPFRALQIELGERDPRTQRPRRFPLAGPALHWANCLFLALIFVAGKAPPDPNNDCGTGLLDYVYFGLVSNICMIVLAEAMLFFRPARRRG